MTAQEQLRQVRKMMDEGRVPKGEEIAALGVATRTREHVR